MTHILTPTGTVAHYRALHSKGKPTCMGICPSKHTMHLKCASIVPGRPEMLVSLSVKTSNSVSVRGATMIFLLQQSGHTASFWQEHDLLIFRINGHRVTSCSESYHTSLRHLGFWNVSIWCVYVFAFTRPSTRRCHDPMSSTCTVSQM